MLSRPDLVCEDTFLAGEWVQAASGKTFGCAAKLKAAMDKVQEHLDDALAKGGQILTGGKPHAYGGQFFEPTIVTNATKDMLVSR